MSPTKFVSRLDMADARVDRENGIIKGVSLVSIGEARGYNQYADQTTLEQVRDCAKKYKGGLRVKFNPSTFNHGDGSLAGRIPGDTIKVVDDQCVGDIHVYKTFAGKEYLFEIAETAPDNCGLSIHFGGIPEKIGEKKFARCDEIFDATIVDLPAANHRGLFKAGEDNAPYGDVQYADPGYQGDKQKRYPVDTAEHAKAAWSYINQDENASKYSSDDLTKVKDSIKSACKKFGIETNEETSMSMTNDQVKTLGEQIVGGLTPVFENAFRIANGNANQDEPSDEEKSAAGVTTDDTPEQAKAKVISWRNKEADKPVTKKDLLQFFRFAGGKPARVSGGAEGDGKGVAHPFLVHVQKYRAAGMNEGKAIMRARADHGKEYNAWVKAGSPGQGKSNPDEE